MNKTEQYAKGCRQENAMVLKGHHRINIIKTIVILIFQQLFYESIRRVNIREHRFLIFTDHNVGYKYLLQKGHSMIMETRCFAKQTKKKMKFTQIPPQLKNNTKTDINHTYNNTTAEKTATSAKNKMKAIKYDQEMIQA